jgi:DNA-binding response OmpR family regulator
MQVVLVDDNEDATELLAASLTAVGIAVHVAHDAASALQLARNVVPDVAFLDIGLPDADGRDLARDLRALPSWKDVRLVALSGFGAERDRASSLEAGFSCHLVKPVELRVILGLLRDEVGDPP